MAVVGTTIWDQIEPGVKMTLGAREPVVGIMGPGAGPIEGFSWHLQFRVNVGKRGITKVLIGLNAGDTYDVKFLQLRAHGADVLAEADGIHVESLNETLLRMETEAAQQP